MAGPRKSGDIALLSACPDFSAVQDGIAHLDGAGCMPAPAEAIRLLDAQNDARGRQIDDLTQKLAAATRTVVKLAASADRWHVAFDRLAGAVEAACSFDAGEALPECAPWAAALDRLDTALGEIRDALKAASTDA